MPECVQVEQRPGCHLGPGREGGRAAGSCELAVNGDQKRASGGCRGAELAGGTSVARCLPWGPHFCGGWQRRADLWGHSSPGKRLCSQNTPPPTAEFPAVKVGMLFLLLVLVPCEASSADCLGWDGSGGGSFFPVFCVSSVFARRLRSPTGWAWRSLCEPGSPVCQRSCIDGAGSRCVWGVKVGDLACSELSLLSPSVLLLCSFPEYGEIQALK